MRKHQDRELARRGGNEAGGLRNAFAEKGVDRVIAMIKQAIADPQPDLLIMLGQMLGMAQDKVENWVSERLKQIESEGLMLDDGKGRSLLITEEIKKQYEQHYQALYNFLTFAQQQVLGDKAPHPKFGEPAAKHPTDLAKSLHDSMLAERKFIMESGLIKQKVKGVGREDIVLGANVAAWLQYKKLFPQNDEGKYSFFWLKFLRQDKISALGSLVQNACFDNCDLSGLDLTAWNLKGADLTRANLAGTKLPEAVEGANMAWADLKNVIIPLNLFEREYVDLTGWLKENNVRYDNAKIERQEYGVTIVPPQQRIQLIENHVNHVERVSPPPSLKASPRLQRRNSRDQQSEGCIIL